MAAGSQIALVALHVLAALLLAPRAATVVLAGATGVLAGVPETRVTRADWRSAPPVGFPGQGERGIRC